ncbi:TonB-dependent receptor [Flavobacteriaceae bacterium M23B6Z8]
MKRFMYLMILLMAGSYSFAQTLSGKVYDQDQFPVEGAFVYNVSSGSHTHTDATGSFYLSETNPGDSITLGRLGYEKRSLKVTTLQSAQRLTVVLEEAAFQLNEVVVRKTENALQDIRSIDLKTAPVQSSQEILRKVPGLFIGQHAGGGKAEQLFLRGFDIDHGTDLSIEVDGLPVNMVSHAHGQGYADLHFVIPETIENINFGKGPYQAAKGNFATAGYVGFQTKDVIDQSFLSLGAGQFNTFRTLGMFKLLSGENRQNAYVAMEYLSSDGFFEAPQNFHRLNLFAKYSGYLNDTDKLAVSLSHFSSEWDASGQIPIRAVQSGKISRFGAIDATEGGNTQRFNLNLLHTKVVDADTFVESQLFFNSYDFELYSNFTFFLNNPEAGDQIRQKENRSIYGLRSTLYHQTTINERPLKLKIGTGLRFDAVEDNELSETQNRDITLEQLQLGDIKEQNIYGFIEGNYSLGKVSLIPALRFDYFRFSYEDALTSEYQVNSSMQSVLSPKMSILYTPTNSLQWFVKAGWGFHSNDARVVTQSNTSETLPQAFGTDVGVLWKAAPRLVFDSALWYLALEDELVYVGDAGIVEPSGRTRRAGVDLGVRYQLSDHLFFDIDATYSYARSIDAPQGEDLIPLAPDFTWTGGLSLVDYKGFSGGVRSRYLNDRPANEDNSIQAAGYFITDLNLNYRWKNYEVGFVIENVFDSEWKETQFATRSRLREETTPVEEIHFTPGTPFNLRAHFKIFF